MNESPCFIYDIIALLSSRIFVVGRSAGIGRQARFRSVCSLRACGFKSHLRHPSLDAGQDSSERSEERGW